MQPPVHITSRDNPLLVRLRKLAQDPTAYRKLGEVWIEGDHLCSACAGRGLAVPQAVLSESAWARPALRQLAGHAARVAVVPDALFNAASGLESPAGCGFLLPWTPQVEVRAGVATVVLDRLQDAGNVGSILRSAAALGVGQVVALRGTAGVWSPKVLRAGMGAHFALHIVEGAVPDDLSRLQLPLLGTSSHTEAELHATRLPSPCAWVLGHEGQGVDEALLARCQQVVRIPQPGGEESLNVAAAAAICLYESLCQRLR
ncbi:TrmH family RNA methyltransferase [Eleftheria terrae]|uniref:TrmH family RNA methyltransferase n=1 Tax=Eleftheria terrae TaxID=1597781 RepID=UPI00263B2E05|nr:RNA methyltransferase [Eleftheria terrae]WKB53652.1 RNA methyltransferase [Eleftheria terrae]